MASRHKNKKMPVKRTKRWTDQETEESESSESYESSSSSSSENEDHNHNVSKYPVTQQLCNERVKDPSPVALLDMLAEVASATLKSDPMIAPTPLTKPPVVKKAVNTINSSRKPTLQSDMLNLDQIRMLSDKLLLNMFSDLTADELRRTYKYTCYLTPDKCQQTYSSFGNENRARMQMKTHLLGHIAQLLAEANSPGRSQRIKFTAEPLHARKKRLAEQNGSKRKFIRKVSRINKAKTCVPSPNLSKSKVAALCARSKSNSGNDASKLMRICPAAKPKEELNKRDKLCAKGKVSKISSNNEQMKHANVTLKTEKVNGSSKLQKKPSLRTLKKQKELNTSHATIEESSLVQENDHRTVENRDIISDHLENKKRQKLCTSEKHAKFNKSLVCTFEEVVDTIDQPQHDHNYTWPSGKKKGIENFDYSSLSDEEFKENETVYTIQTIGDCIKSEIEDDSYNIISTGMMSPTAIIPQATSPTATSIYAMPVDPNVGHTVEVASDSCNMVTVKKEHISCSKQKRIRRINKIVVPEEFESESSEFSEEEIDDKEFEEMDVNPIPKSSPLKNKQKKKFEKGTPEWERKLALKCIRMLRSKRKDERVALICRICKNKTFTAQATLMYHYRSHAGIKPFVCTICNTTFTRQHSLNYHMLIHNNKSRFTCMECGRKFRHPSHFKEHMRRHTGETPFECADCGLRFKTRNTYKRHLKTRHGKLLTANGIMLLSSEEFSKVKTTPRKKGGRRKDKETQWPEISNGLLSKATETEIKLLDG